MTSNFPELFEGCTLAYLKDLSQQQSEIGLLVCVCVCVNSKLSEHDQEDFLQRQCQTSIKLHSPSNR